MRRTTTDDDMGTAAAPASSAISRRQVLGGALGLAAAGASSSSARATEARPALFHAADGRPHRGVAVGDALLARDGRPAADYVVLARDWNATVVRLSMHPGVWLADRRLAMAGLEHQVTQARIAGLSVVIDWHPIGWPDGPEEHADPSWGMPERSYATDLELAHQFWAQVSARYSDDDEVLFEIWNEPVRLDRRGGASAPGRDWADLRPIWLDLTATVRRNAGNRLIASGGRWASDLTGVRSDPLPDARTGYSWHVYPGTGDRDPDRMEALLDGLPEERAVFVTEWGFGGRADHLRGTSADFGATFARRFLNRHDLAWTSWCWHPTWEPRLIEPDWRTPTEAGAFVRDLLAAPRPR